MEKSGESKVNHVHYDWDTKQVSDKEHLAELCTLNRQGSLITLDCVLVCSVERCEIFDYVSVYKLVPLQAKEMSICRIILYRDEVLLSLVFH